MEAAWKSHEKPVALKGNVYVSTYGQTKVHSYLSPPDGLMVNTQIVEGHSSVVIFDGQLHLPYAEEVASYIKTIGKPVDRFHSIARAQRSLVWIAGLDGTISCSRSVCHCRCRRADPFARKQNPRKSESALW